MNLVRTISGTHQTKAGPVEVELSVMVSGPKDGAIAALEKCLAHLRENGLEMVDGHESAGAEVTAACQRES